MYRIEGVTGRGLSRRNFLAGLGCTAGAAAAIMATGCSESAKMTTPNTPSSPTSAPMNAAITDVDILNFALNLEYLEAEYYLRATTGSGLSSSDIGSNAGAVTGGTQVPFKTPAIQEVAMEIANDEQAHVRFLRKALGSSAVSRPALDFTDAFNAAASAAGIGYSFNPFVGEDQFLIGAFTFEDVGVTAYHGAAPLLKNATDLEAAAAIMAVEGYHAAAIRTLIVQLGSLFITVANQISALRATAGGGKETQVSASTITAADSNSIAYDRTTDEVLHIVYLDQMAGVVKKGGFFPDGLNGTITATAS